MSTATYISATELANELGLPLAWLRAEAKAGKIPSLRVGRRLLFNPESVKRVLLNRTAKEVAND